MITKQTQHFNSASKSAQLVDLGSSASETTDAVTSFSREGKIYGIDGNEQSRALTANRFKINERRNSIRKLLEGQHVSVPSSKALRDYFVIELCETFSNNSDPLSERVRKMDEDEWARAEHIGDRVLNLCLAEELAGHLHGAAIACAEGFVRSNENYRNFLVFLFEDVPKEAPDCLEVACCYLRENREMVQVAYIAKMIVNYSITYNPHWKEIPSKVGDFFARMEERKIQQAHRIVGLYPYAKDFNEYCQKNGYSITISSLRHGDMFQCILKVSDGVSEYTFESEALNKMDAKHLASQKALEYFRNPPIEKQMKKSKGNALEAMFNPNGGSFNYNHQKAVRKFCSEGSEDRKSSPLLNTIKHNGTACDEDYLKEKYVFRKKKKNTKPRTTSVKIVHHSRNPRALEFRELMYDAQSIEECKEKPLIRSPQEQLYPLEFRCMARGDIFYLDKDYGRRVYSDEDRYTAFLCPLHGVNSCSVTVSRVSCFDESFVLQNLEGKKIFLKCSNDGYVDNEKYSSLWNHITIADRLLSGGNILSITKGVEYDWDGDSLELSSCPFHLNGRCVLRHSIRPFGDAVYIDEIGVYLGCDPRINSTPSIANSSMLGELLGDEVDSPDNLLNTLESYKDQMVEFVGAENINNVGKYILQAHQIFSDFKRSWGEKGFIHMFTVFLQNMVKFGYLTVTQIADMTVSFIKSFLHILWHFLKKWCILAFEGFRDGYAYFSEKGKTVFKMMWPVKGTKAYAGREPGTVSVEGVETIPQADPLFMRFVRSIFGEKSYIVEGSSIWKKSSHLMALFPAAAILTFVGIKPKLEVLESWVGSLPDVISGCSTLIDWFIEVIQKVLPACMKGDVSFLAREETQLESWMKTVLELEKIVASDESGRVHEWCQNRYGITDTPQLVGRFSDEITLLTALGESFSKNLKLAESVKFVVTRLTVFLQIVRKDVRKYFSGFNARICPVAIQIWGEPGVGKTALALQLIPYLKDIFQFKNDTMYAKSAEAYWSGFTNNHEICLYDDEGMYEKTLYTIENIEGLIRGIGTFPYCVPMADITSKGNTFFNCKLVIGTSNFQDFNAAGKFMKVDALLRRFKVSIKVEKNIDFSATNSLDQKVYSLILRESSNGALNLRSIGGGLLSFRELVQHLVPIVRDLYENERKYYTLSTAKCAHGFMEKACVQCYTNVPTGVIVGAAASFQDQDLYRIIHVPPPLVTSFGYWDPAIFLFYIPFFEEIFRFILLLFVGPLFVIPFFSLLDRNYYTLPIHFVLTFLHDQSLFNAIGAHCLYQWFVLQYLIRVLNFEDLINYMNRLYLTNYVNQLKTRVYSVAAQVYSLGSPNPFSTNRYLYGWTWKFIYQLGAHTVQTESQKAVALLKDNLWLIPIPMAICGAFVLIRRLQKSGQKEILGLDIAIDEQMYGQAASIDDVIAEKRVTDIMSQKHSFPSYANPSKLPGYFTEPIKMLVNDQKQDVFHKIVKNTVEFAISYEGEKFHARGIGIIENGQLITVKHLIPKDGSILDVVILNSNEQAKHLKGKRFSIPRDYIFVETDRFDLAIISFDGHIKFAKNVGRNAFADYFNPKEYVGWNYVFVNHVGAHDIKCISYTTTSTSGIKGTTFGFQGYDWVPGCSGGIIVARLMDGKHRFTTTKIIGLHCGVALDVKIDGKSVSVLTSMPPDFCDRIYNRGSLLTGFQSIPLTEDGRFSTLSDTLEFTEVERNSAIRHIDREYYDNFACKFKVYAGIKSEVGFEKSRLYKRDLHYLFSDLIPDIGFPTFKEGGSMAPFKYDGRWISSHLNALSAVSEQPAMRNLVVLREAKIAVFDFLIQASNFTPIAPPYSYHQTLSGDTNAGLEPIKYNSSAGYPYPGRKRDYVTGLPGIDLGLVKEINNDLHYIINLALEGYAPAAIYKYCLKDEAVKRDKVLAGKIRLFSASQFSIFILCRMIFGPIFTWMISFRKKMFCKLGINMMGSELHVWVQDMINKEKMGWKSMDGDYAWFDKRMLSLKAALDVMIMLMVWSKWDEKFILIARSLATTYYEYFLLFLNTLLLMCDSGPSGSLGTAAINSIWEAIIEVIIYILCLSIQFKLDTEQAIKAFRKHPFFENVDLANYGDDNLKQVSPKAQIWLTASNIKIAASSLGVILTDAEDKNQPPFYKTLFETSFLKRNFRWSSDHNRYVAPIQKKSIYKMLCWGQESGTNPFYILKTCVENSLMEMSLHGKDEYGKFVSKLKSHTFDKEYDPLFSTYEELVSLYLEREDSGYTNVLNAEEIEVPLDPADPGLLEVENFLKNEIHASLA